MKKKKESKTKQARGTGLIIYLADTEVTELDKALSGIEKETGFKPSRAAFAKNAVTKAILATA